MPPSSRQSTSLSPVIKSRQPSPHKGIPQSNMKKLLPIACVLAIYGSALAVTNPPAANVTLDNFKLVGELSGEQATFTLTATARVESHKGASLELLSGAVALTEATTHPQWRIQVQQNRYVVVFDHAGKFPLKVKFSAAVRQ